MLKFFRKIRQQLISENKFSSYLFYAIGEIALVVIGILLALQISTWNQSRQNRQLEMEYLTRLQSDLQADTAMLIEFQRVTAYKTDFLKSILKDELKEFKVTKADNSDLLNIHASRFSSVPVPRDNAFQEMQSSGNLGLIQNDQLKESIFNYYRLLRSRTAALNGKFSDWPKVISSLIPGEGNIFDFGDVNKVNISLKEMRDFVTVLNAEKENLRPHINAELQYAQKQKISFELLLKAAERLLEKLAKEIDDRAN